MSLFFRIFALTFANHITSSIMLNFMQPTFNVNIHGAELSSLKVLNQEFIWQADPTFWRRHAPILFPIVGKVWDGTYHVDGQAYHLPQHGFARDTDFQVVEQTNNHVVMQLESTAETLQKYPYPFRLTADYRLENQVLHCRWTVSNPVDTPIYFQIGAHPAFNLLDFQPDSPVYGYLQFSSKGQQVNLLQVTQLSEKGHALKSSSPMPLSNGLLPLTPTLFQHDALVLQDSQVDRVVLCDKQQKPYLAMTFDAPVLGIWSPIKAPFCCIEPWYGRTDAEGFCGDIQQRDYIQSLAPHSSFEFYYTIQTL